MDGVLFIRWEAIMHFYQGVLGRQKNNLTCHGFKKTSLG